MVEISQQLIKKPQKGVKSVGKSEAAVQPVSSLETQRKAVTQIMLKMGHSESYLAEENGGICGVPVGLLPALQENNCLLRHLLAGLEARTQAASIGSKKRRRDSQGFIAQPKRWPRRKQKNYYQCTYSDIGRCLLLSPATYASAVCSRASG